MAVTFGNNQKKKKKQNTIKKRRRWKKNQDKVPSLEARIGFDFRK